LEDYNDDDGDWEVNDSNNNEDIVSFLLNNVLPRQKRVDSTGSLKKQVCPLTKTYLLEIRQIWVAFLGK
jgi:hypothetical protein